MSEPWADHGWRDPVGDRPGEGDEVLVMIRYPRGFKAVAVAWVGADEDEPDTPCWMWDSAEHPEMVENSHCRVIGWQHMPEACETPASKSNSERGEEG